MKAYVLAGSILAAGMISALIAQQATDQPGQTGQYGRQTGQQQTGQQQTGQTDQIRVERSGARGEENLANMSPEQRFLYTSYQCNLFETQLSKMVAQKADRDEIKEFARKLSDEHTQANQQIRQVAQRKNVQLPQDVSEWQQAKLQHASRVPTDMLSRLFVFHQVGMHNSEILEHRWAANHIKDQDVKMLATQMLPDLQTHLRQAEQFSQQIIRGEGTVTER